MADRLTRFARSHYGADWLQDALEAAGLLDEDVDADADAQIVIPWLHHFAVNRTIGSTLADEWRRQERRMSADEARVLDAYADSWLSLWEVEEVQVGVGSRLMDRLTGVEQFVHDVRTSESMQRFDTILAMVVTCEGVSFFGGLHPQPLPPRFAQAATQQARGMCRVRTRNVSPEKLRDPEMQLELVALWGVVVDELLDQPPPVLQNTDGDPVVPTTDDFALLAPREEVTRRLASLDGVSGSEEYGDDTVFVVTTAGNAVHRSWDNTIIAHIALSNARLAIQTNSTRRADSIRFAVERHLQGLARFRLRKEENTTKLLAAAREAAATGAPRPQESLPPEAAAALREHREQHLRDWLDDRIPALDGHTPREAARLSGVRPKLEVLLKEFEQSEARQPEQQRIDLGWLRENLGFR